MVTALVVAVSAFGAAVAYVVYVIVQAGQVERATEQIRDEVHLAIFTELENGLISPEQFDVLITLMNYGETSMPNWSNA